MLGDAAERSSMFSGLLQSIVLANTQKTQIKHRKLVEVGLTRFLVRCDSVLNDPKLWSVSTSSSSKTLTCVKVKDAPQC